MFRWRSVTQAQRLSRLLQIGNGRYLVAVTAAFVIGVCLRYAWALSKPDAGFGEADRVAMAVASGRGFADAYRLGQGATAHLMPVSPAIAGLIYFVSGTHTVWSTLLIATWSIGLCCSSYLLFNRAFSQLGVSESARAQSLIYLCLVPIYVGQEAQVLGVWDGGLTVFLLALVLVQLTSRPCPIRLAMTDSALFFVNPIFGFGSFIASAMRVPARKLAIFGVTAFVCIASLIGPWTLRNLYVLDSPVLTRSNAGLELALATNPRMLTDAPQEISFTQRLREIHPSVNDAAYREVQKIGEVAYSAKLGIQAWEWIKSHPADELRLILFHLRNTFAPQPWMFRIWSNPAGAVARSALASLTGAMGLLGIIVGVARKRRYWPALALLVFIPALILSPFQPISRYIYVFYAMLVFSAGGLLAEVRCSSRTAKAGNGAS